MLELAGKYRHRLSLQMADQEEELPQQCAICRNEISNVHMPSDVCEGSGSKVLVAPCRHLIHMRCLQQHDAPKACPMCSKPLKQLYVAIKSCHNHAGICMHVYETAGQSRPTWHVVTCRSCRVQGALRRTGYFAALSRSCLSSA